MGALFGGGGDMSKLIDPMVCKLRFAAQLAVKNKCYDEVLKPLKDSSAWKQLGSELSPILTCVKGDKPIKTCEDAANKSNLAKNPMMLMVLAQPVAAMMKVM